jgi:hypothetical protein
MAYSIGYTTIIQKYPLLIILLALKLICMFVIKVAYNAHGEK